VAELLRNSESYLIQDLLREAQAKIKAVVMDRMRVFGSAGACMLPGNICPSGGACSCGGACGTKTQADSLSVRSRRTSEKTVSENELAYIVTRVVSEILKKNSDV